MNNSLNDVSVSKTVDINLVWFNLNFLPHEKHLEQPFRDKYFNDCLKHLRYCHFYTIFFYLLAGLLDYFLFPQNVFTLFFIRFFFVIPVFIVGYLFTFSHHYKDYWQQISVFYILLTGGSFILFTVIAQPPKAYDYYTGIVISMMFGYTFIRERFIYASIAGLTLTFSYLFVSAVVVNMPTHNLFQNNLYIFTANFLGMLIARHLEITARRDYYLEYQLSIKQKKVLELNTGLEERVKSRTRELELSNQALKDKIDELHKSEAERIKLEGQLRQAYKMEAIGTMAGGIAHDFNNILSSIIGYTELAFDETEKESELEQYLQEVYTAAIRATDLIKQILAFARQTQEELKPIKVRAIVKEVIKLLRSSIPANIEIRKNIQSDSYVFGDSISLHQLIMNLGANASHAMDEGGILEISAIDVTIDNPADVDAADLIPGDYIKLSVSDTGAGIDPQIIEVIFEPYFTTKKVGEGTGMGLAVVYGIVKKLNGKITVTSELGAGTVFTVYFPITTQREIAQYYQFEELPVGDERILLVDDEQSLAKMGSRMLEGLGYQVTVCTNSEEALELFRAKPNNYDLVITDTTMPRLTGDKLAVELMKIRADIPVILCTGYNKKITDETAKNIGIKAFVYKPIVKSDLSAIVRSVLDEAVKNVNT